MFFAGTVWCCTVSIMGGTRNLKLGQRGGKGQGTGGAMEIGVWGLWAKCRPGLELPGVRGLNPKPQFILQMLIFE